MVRGIPVKEKCFIGGNLNGHVEISHDGFVSIYKWEIRANVWDRS